VAETASAVSTTADIADGLALIDEFAFSIHESAHTLLARHFGKRVTTVNLQRVGVEHEQYNGADCVHVDQRLIVAMAGDVATVKWNGWKNSGGSDVRRSMTLLHKLGVSFPDSLGRLSKARIEAERLCEKFKPEIFRVAAALRELRILTQIEIDAAIEGSDVLAKLVRQQTAEAIEMKKMADARVALSKRVAAARDR
jgi:hypothetical protein